MSHPGLRFDCSSGLGSRRRARQRRCTRDRPPPRRGSTASCSARALTPSSSGRAPRCSSPASCCCCRISARRRSAWGQPDDRAVAAAGRAALRRDLPARVHVARRDPRPSVGHAGRAADPDPGGGGGGARSDADRARLLRALRRLVGISLLAPVAGDRHALSLATGGAARRAREAAHRAAALRVVDSLAAGDVSALGLGAQPGLRGRSPRLRRSDASRLGDGARPGGAGGAARWPSWSWRGQRRARGVPLPWPTYAVLSAQILWFTIALYHPLFNITMVPMFHGLQYLALTSWHATREPGARELLAFRPLSGGGAGLGLRRPAASVQRRHQPGRDARAVVDRGRGGELRQSSPLPARWTHLASARASRRPVDDRVRSAVRTFAGTHRAESVPVARPPADPVASRLRETRRRRRPARNRRRAWTPARRRADTKPPSGPAVRQRMRRSRQPGRAPYTVAFSSTSGCA